MNPRAAKLKILIVDDHAGIRGVVRRTCSALPCEFIECDSGEAALKAYQEHQPDWIVMDVQMPGMNGLQAAAAIHQLDEHARIIMMSQFAEPDYAELARRAGAIEFVSKADVSHVAEIIRRQPPLQP